MRGLKPTQRSGSPRDERKQKELEEQLASEEEAANPEPPQIPNLVLSDPPWRYDFAETDSRQIENQYPSATVGEICNMPPKTQPDAVLFLWATVSKLTEAFEVMSAWGFEYKTRNTPALFPGADAGRVPRVPPKGGRNTGTR